MQQQAMQQQAMQQPAMQQQAMQQPAPQEPVTQGTVPVAATAQPAVLSPDTASATRTSRIGAVLLGLGVVLGIASLFPAYVAGASIASQPPSLVTHVAYLAAWSLSAVLIVMGGARLRVGALFGLSVSAITFGLFIADAGTPIAGQGHFGAGLVFASLGWLACTVGAGLALPAALSVQTIHAGNGVASKRGLARQLGRASSYEIVPLVTLVLAAVGAAIAFAPSWDKFTLQTASGTSQVITLGNAFSNPAPVIFGNVLVMAAIVAVVIVAALWRPTRIGAALAAGAIVPMVAEAISAVVQILEPASPAQFGVSQAQASQLGLTISAGLTPMFWVFCAFVATMILLCIWMMLSREPVSRQVSPYDLGPSPASPASAGNARDDSQTERLQTGSP
jgi:hypothetical protein